MNRVVSGELGKLMRLVGALREASPRGRILRGIAANFYDKGAVMLVQILAIPVLTSQWGPEGYGVWLMLLTIPTYILLSDFGVCTAAGVEITRFVAEERLDKALDVLQSAWVFVLAVVSLVALFGLAIAALVAFGDIVRDSVFGLDNLALAIAFIVFYSVLSTQMNLLTIVYQATHKFVFAMVIAGTLILLEGGALIAISLTGGKIAAAAGAYCGIRLVGYMVFKTLLQRREPWVRLGTRHASRKTLRRLTRPSLAGLSLMLSNALALQGAVLALGWFAGPAAVAVFGATRTLTRAPLQLAGMVIRPSLPELTRAHVAKDMGMMRRLTQTNVLVACGAMLPFTLLFIFAGQPLLDLVSNGQLTAPPALFSLLAGAATANAVWTAAASPLVATNRQGMFAYWYLMLAAGVALTPVFGGNTVQNLGYAMLLSEAVTGIIVTKIILTKALWRGYAGGTS